jgi:hypothetical protein
MKCSRIDYRSCMHMRADGEPSGFQGVVVLGMDRSGTSATARMFHRSGFFVGAGTDMMEADEANPTGYFENLKVWRVNERVLCDLGYSLCAPGGLEQLTPSADYLRPLREVLAQILAAADSAPLVLKDPRISMLIRLWGPLVEGVLHPVLVVRHPGEVALSLARRDCLAIPAALALWEHRLSLLLQSLDGIEASVVPYSLVLSKPSLASEVVAEISGLLRPALRNAVDWTNASGAFEPHIRRNRMLDGDGEREMTERQRRLWRLLDSLGAGLATLEAPLWLREPDDAITARECQY